MKKLLKRMAAAACVAVLMVGSGHVGSVVSRQQYRSFSASAIMRELSLPDLFDGANPAVVAISTTFSGRNAFGQTVTRPAAGSGFFISADGYIITNTHVIEGASSITVLLYNGNAHTATVVGQCEASDIAVIKINISDWAYLSIGDSCAVRVGEQVAAIGNPLGELANSMTIGHISALNRDISIEGVTRNKLQTDAAVNRGNSGGPLLNLRGEVIGVVNAKTVGDGVEGLGFAIPSNQARAVAEQLINYGFVRGRVVLGIMVNEIAQIGGQGRTVRVASVNSGGAAYTAGIRVNDIILYADGTAVSTFDGLRAVLDRFSPGDEMSVLISRGGAEYSKVVVLDEYRA